MVNLREGAPLFHLTRAMTVRDWDGQIPQINLTNVNQNSISEEGKWLQHR